MSPIYTSFAEFWPFYLSQHSHPASRKLHVFGTVMGLIWVVGCLILGRMAWLPGAFVLGYGPAWIGHFGFEKNRPATFTYPLWSFRADFKMLFLFLTGGLPTELKRFGIHSGT
jgi:hypothetical protein